MACTPQCVKPTPAQCHCVAECHQTFGGVTMFDRHRRDGRCLDPAECGMTYRDGIWRETLTDSQRGALERLKRANAAVRRR